MFDIIGTVFPMLVIFLLLRGILQTILGGSRRRQEDEPDYEEEEEESEAYGEERPDAKKPDLAAEFERRLQKTSETAQSAKAEAPSAQEIVISPRKERQRVHRDDEAPHAAKGRIHRDGESFAHDKGKVYYDPNGDYSYNEARFNAQAAAFRAHRAALSRDEAQRPRVKLKHSALVQGFIMSQVLDKPRSLKPYGAEEML
ncbi:MAG: hypothetical protein Q4E64_11320 [Phascolarctobacterium sp.]|uniref:hypothetical protein n=1 Tax=Phascolarctobacterium sp. TaxID=2049039 RepID=UPI0026DACC61|nr:hypothetical protein [Phascolarctobacterium sp.]MDO4922398.1 hypothetical protein [Phascolarctobacterium sp.]